MCRLKAIIRLLQDTTPSRSFNALRGFMAQERIVGYLEFVGIRVRASRARGGGGIRFGGAGNLRRNVPKFSSRLYGRTPEGEVRAKMVTRKKVKIRFNGTGKMPKQSLDWVRVN